jgi:hypothetical protein
VKFTICNAPQRSEAWFKDRLGLATGSRAGDIVAKIKSGEAAARRDYRCQLVAERLTGKPQENDFVNADMERGIALEADARRAYEAHTGLLAEETGFLRSVELDAGCSLDGAINAFEGVLEIKCPRTATHLNYLRENRLPARYTAQATHNVFVSGAKWIDFVSYCPALPENLSLFVVRVEAKDLDLEGYAAELKAFLAEVREETESLKNWRLK